jgi:hypothetical protein
MKKFLLIFFLSYFTLLLQAQQGVKEHAVVNAVPQRVSGGESANIRISIYPVPVRNNTFTIKSDKDISLIKVTNIIGQDILKTKYNNPQQQIRIDLDSPQRGMYLVTIIFSDGLRVVKKIMIEESK